MGKAVAVVLVLAGLAVIARLDRGGHVDLAHLEGHAFGLGLRVELTVRRSRERRSPAPPDACVLPDSVLEAWPWR
jgi:hypothetical protein